MYKNYKRLKNIQSYNYVYLKYIKQWQKIKDKINIFMVKIVL